MGRNADIAALKVAEHVAAIVEMKTFALQRFAFHAQRLIPKDTRRARRGLRAGIRRSSYVPPKGRTNDFQTAAQIAAAVTGMTIDAVLWLVNNLLYAAGLEAGKSRQAPQGFLGQAWAATLGDLGKRYA